MTSTAVLTEMLGEARGRLSELRRRVAFEERYIQDLETMLHRELEAPGCMDQQIEELADYKKFKPALSPEEKIKQNIKRKAAELIKQMEEEPVEAPPGLVPDPKYPRTATSTAVQRMVEHIKVERSKPYAPIEPPVVLTAAPVKKKCGRPSRKSRATPYANTPARVIWELMSDGQRRSIKQMAELIGKSHKDVYYCLYPWQHLFNIYKDRQPHLYCRADKDNGPPPNVERDYFSKPVSGTIADKAISYLSNFPEGTEMAAAEIAKAIEHSPASVTNALTTWERHQLIERTSKGKWRLYLPPSEEDELIPIASSNPFKEDEPEPLPPITASEGEQAVVRQKIIDYFQETEYGKPFLMSPVIEADVNLIIHILESNDCFRKEVDGWTYAPEKSETQLLNSRWRGKRA